MADNFLGENGTKKLLAIMKDNAGGSSSGGGNGNIDLDTLSQYFLSKSELEEILYNEKSIITPDKIIVTKNKIIPTDNTILVEDPETLIEGLTTYHFSDSVLNSKASNTIITTGCILNVETKGAVTVYFKTKDDSITYSTNSNISFKFLNPTNEQGNSFNYTFMSSSVNIYGKLNSRSISFLSAGKTQFFIDFTIPSSDISKNDIKICFSDLVSIS